MIFVDTGAWFASVIPSDADYQNAISWLVTNSQTLITSDYIVDETLTLLRARGESRRAITLGNAFFSNKLSAIYYLTEGDIHLTWEIFKQFSDKQWSFTDCSSKLVMQKLKITQAFSFDRHFSQFATVLVLPP
jgi:uncharacterized protein